MEDASITDADDTPFDDQIHASIPLKMMLIRVLADRRTQRYQLKRFC